MVTLNIRTLLRLVTFGVVFDLVVSMAVIVLAIQANTAASSAHIARVANYQSCVRGNDTRAAILAFLVTLMPKNPTTAQQQVLKSAQGIFRPIDCKKVTT